MLTRIAAVSVVCLIGCGSQADNTEPEPVPPSPNLDETAALVVDCLQEDGWPASLLDGGFTIADDPRTATEQEEAVEACFDHLMDQGLIPSVEPLTGEMLEARYEYLLSMQECLESEGHSLPEPPSRESFIDSQGINWTPFGLLPEMGSGEFSRLTEICPQAGP